MSDPDETAPMPRPTGALDSSESDVCALTDADMAALLASDTLPVNSPSGQRGWHPPTVADLQRALPQYDVQSLIARGGMGAVYKGTQKALRRTVAIKVLPPDLEDGDMQFAARFKHEAQAMAHLSHPCIVAVFDAGETPDGLLYFVMEYIEGTDVAQLIASEGRVDPQRAVMIIGAVCDALGFAHESGIIHRDIKPSNIMVDRKGRVKVADFGLAKAVNLEGALLTGSNISMGTPDFIAPEALIAGMKVDQRADLYAVGVMLYQMLTGNIPRGRFQLPSRMLPEIDPGFDAIVDRAMQTDRDKRYSTAQEMRTDLDKVVQSFRPAVAEASPPTGTETPKTVGPKPRPRFSKRLPAAIIAVVVLLAGVGWWLLKSGDQGRSAGHVSAPVVTSTPSAALEPGAIKLRDSPEKIPKRVGVVWEETTEPWRDVLGEYRRGGALKNHHEFEDDGSHVRVHSDYDLVLDISDAPIRNGAVRVAWALPAKGSASLKLRCSRGSAGQPVRDYQARFEPKTVNLLIHDYADKSDVLLHEWNYPDGFELTAEHTCEFRVVDDLLSIRLDGREIGSMHDQMIQPPGLCVVGLQAGMSFSALEMLRLDAPSEAEVLKLAGAGVQGRAPPSVAVTPAAKAEAFWRSRWSRPGRLRAAGTDMNGKPFDLTAAGPYEDFVQVMAVDPGRPASKPAWIALRANGDELSGEGHVERGRLALLPCEHVDLRIFAGGITKATATPPAVPVIALSGASLLWLPGRPLVAAYADVQGVWHLDSAAFDQGQVGIPDLITPPEVTKVIVGASEIGVLRADGTLRIWHPQEMKLPDIIAREVKDVVDLGGEWAVLKNDGLVLIANWGMKNNEFPAVPAVRESIKGGTAIVSGGYTIVVKRADGDWTIGGPGVVDDTLAKLHTENNESFSVFHGQGGSGILWIEPVPQIRSSLEKSAAKN